MLLLFQGAFALALVAACLKVIVLVRVSTCTAKCLVSSLQA